LDFSDIPINTDLIEEIKKSINEQEFIDSISKISKNLKLVGNEPEDNNHNFKLFE
jgi:hypothetical protein